MTTPIRGTGGRFAGSIGRGKTATPTSAPPRPTPARPTSDFEAGEHAAEQRILTMLATLRRNRERLLTGDPALMSPMEKGTLIGATRAIDEATDAIRDSRAPIPIRPGRDPVIAALADTTCVPYEALIADRALRVLLDTSAPTTTILDRIDRVHVRGEKR